MESSQRKAEDIENSSIHLIIDDIGVGPVNVAN